MIPANHLFPEKKGIPIHGSRSSPLRMARENQFSSRLIAIQFRVGCSRFTALCLIIISRAAVYSGTGEESRQTRNYLSRHCIQIKQTTKRDKSRLFPSRLHSAPVALCSRVSLAHLPLECQCRSDEFSPELDLEFKSTFELIKTQTLRGEIHHILLVPRIGKVPA